MVELIPGIFAYLRECMKKKTNLSFLKQGIFGRMFVIPSKKVSDQMPSMDLKNL